MSPSDRSGPPDADLHDDALAALYRQAAREEPSPRHDAAILAAAAAEVARPAEPRRSWWSRWRIGLSVTATVVLSAGIVLLVEREQTREAAGEWPASRPPAPSSQPGAEAERKALEAPQAPANTTRQDKDAEQGGAANPAAPGEPAPRAPTRDAADTAKPRGNVSPQPTAPAAAPEQGRNAVRQDDSGTIRQPMSPPAKPLEPFPEDGKPSKKAEGAPPAVSPYSITAPKASAPPSALPGALLPQGGEGRSRGAAPLPPASAPIPPPAESPRAESDSAAAPSARERVVVTPQDELAEIRALLRAGRTEDARKAVAVFLRRHPDFALPADLEALRPPRE